MKRSWRSAADEALPLSVALLLLRSDIKTPSAAAFLPLFNYPEVITSAADRTIATSQQSFFFFFRLLESQRELEHIIKMNLLISVDLKESQSVVSFHPTP